MTDQTNNNSKRWIHSSEVSSLRNKKIKSPPPKKIEDAFFNGQKKINGWFREWMNKDKNDND